MESLAFTASAPNTLGIELELQIVDPVTHDLRGGAEDLLAQLANHRFADQVKPEITRAMIEINSSVHQNPATLLTEMRELRDALNEAADAVGVRIAGGGTHPFMRWQDRTIFDSPRFQYVSELYGYLARQFTVFGQHIHLGVGSGDEAIDLTHRLSPYMPHFIALSASSPFQEGVDTLFSSSRLNALNAFPMAGHLPPEIRDWYQFEAHYSSLKNAGLVESLKDFYWDLRPKPEFGTVEIRVCDTPLSVEKACQLAAFAQALSVLVQGEPVPAQDTWLAYKVNRFQASRFGLQAHYVDAVQGRMRLIDHMRDTFDRVMPVSEQLGTTELVAALRADVLKLGCDAKWLRAQMHRNGELRDVVGSAVNVWRGEEHVSPDLAGPVTISRRRVRAGSEPMGVHALTGDRPFDRPPEQLH